MEQHVGRGEPYDLIRASMVVLLAAALGACACGDDDEMPGGDASVDGGDGDGGVDAGTDAGEQPAPPDPLLDAIQPLEEASARPAIIRVSGGSPRFVVGSWTTEGADAVARAEEFLETWSDAFGQGGPDLDHPLRSVAGGDPDIVRFFQTYRGLPVYGGGIVVGLRGSEVIAAIGNLLTTRETVGTVPAVGPLDAEALARTYLGGTTAPVRGETQLVVFDPALLDETAAHAPRLAWRVTIGEAQLLVGATDGQIVFETSLRLDDFDLDLEHANGRNASDTYCYWWTTDDDSAGDEDGVYSDYLDDAIITSTWWNVLGAYDYYVGFGRDSYDDDAAQSEVYDHTSSTGGASYSIYCDLFEFTDPFIAYDITVHEFTHAVIAATSGLVYANETGALNESFADAMGSFAESSNWLMGETSANGELRDLENPERHDQPDRYSGYRQKDFSDDSGGVHTNSGIMNKAAVLIADGGTFNGWTTAGIGIGKAQQLYYFGLQLVPDSSSFAQAAAAMTAIAKGWAAAAFLGFTLDDACDVANAFAAVEVGVGDRDCDGSPDSQDLDDDNDWVVDGVDNCNLVKNPSQTDDDHDGIGNACDDDDDDDGVLDVSDNCRKPNHDQADSDHDGVGDVCQDQDGDGLADDVDNCAYDVNPDQADADGDGEGDACDPDFDGDGLSGSDDDNCPWDYNPDQLNTDGDGYGDACDRCPATSELVEAWATGIPDLGIPPHPFQPDTDGDGVPDACDTSGFGSDNIVAFDGLEISPIALPLLADGRSHRVDLDGLPNEDLSIAIPICPDGCPEVLPPGYRVSLDFQRLPASIAVYVGDETGRALETNRRAALGADGLPLAVRSLHFAPVLGRAYRLHFVLRSGFDEAARVTFQVTMDAQ